MFIGEISVDFNGIVLFDPDLLQQRYGGTIPRGTDLFTRYTTTEEGDEVIKAGLIVPVLAIDDDGYTVVVRLAGETWNTAARVVRTNSVYPLLVHRRLVLADLAVLKEWIPELDWQDISVPPGRYSVTVNGFQTRKPGSSEIVDAGYEFILVPVETLPQPTADLGKDMNVLRDSQPS